MSRRIRGTLAVAVSVAILLGSFSMAMSGGGFRELSPQEEEGLVSGAITHLFAKCDKDKTCARCAVTQRCVKTPKIINQVEVTFCLKDLLQPASWGKNGCETTATVKVCRLLCSLNPTDTCTNDQEGCGWLEYTGCPTFPDENGACNPIPCTVSNTKKCRNCDPSA